MPASLTWVVVDGLPANEGEDLVLDACDIASFDVEDMKRWCEGSGHCVGFAYWVEGRGKFPLSLCFHPKEKDTGFDEHSAVWKAEKAWQWYYIRERAQAAGGEEEAQEVAAVESMSTSLINHDHSFKPLSPTLMASFLEARGFPTIGPGSWRLVDLQEWQSQMPHLFCSVVSHEEAGAHTWYSLQCQLKIPNCTEGLSWLAPRRLVHMREFHDRLKVELGTEAYLQVFVDEAGQRIHFANRGGLVGTTARLNAWFCALVAAINAGHATPSLVAMLLHFLRAPSLDTQERDRASTTDPDNSESPHPCQVAPTFSDLL